MSERDGRITIFGASGYTGRIMLAEARRLGLPIRLAGRNEARLREAAVAAGMDAPIVVADVGDQASLERMTDGCSVLVNCCGPFTELGEPVLASAVRADAHYIDITGDQGFTRRMYERFDEEARKRGVALVCALGFESTLGDMGAALLAGMPGAPPRFEAVTVGYAVHNLEVSQGTRLSLERIGVQGSYVKEHGVFKEMLVGAERESFRFPEPVGEQITYFIPLPEVVFIPQHVEVERVATYMLLPEQLAAKLHAKAKTARDAPYKAPPPQEGPPAGPDEAARARNHFALCVKATADGWAQQVHFTGTDMYAWSVRAALLGAVRMLAPDFDGAGALAPSVAFDPRSFLDDLARQGLEIADPYAL